MALRASAALESTQLLRHKQPSKRELMSKRNAAEYKNKRYGIVSPFQQKLKETNAREFMLKSQVFDSSQPIMEEENYPR